jgi:hypothetical protein
MSLFFKKRPDDFRRLRMYREFLRALFDESDMESRRQRFTYVDPKGKIIFAFLDSTLKNLTPLPKVKLVRASGSG